MGTPVSSTDSHGVTRADAPGTGGNCLATSPLIRVSHLTYTGWPGDQPMDPSTLQCQVYLSSWGPGWGAARITTLVSWVNCGDCLSDTVFTHPYTRVFPAYFGKLQAVGVSHHGWPWTHGVVAIHKHIAVSLPLRFPSKQRQMLLCIMDSLRGRPTPNLFFHTRWSDSLWGSLLSALDLNMPPRMWKAVCLQAQLTPLQTRSSHNPSLILSRAFHLSSTRAHR